MSSGKGDPRQQSPPGNNSANDIQSEEEDDSDNEVNYQHGAVLNLLDIGNSSRWRDGGRISLGNLGSIGGLSHLVQVSVPDSGNMDLNFTSARSSQHDIPMNKGDFSITKFFEPKFLEVFTKYVESLGREPDLNRHLLSVCLDNLIDFSCWARDSSTQCQWIRETLDENADLRPEVRNGLAMILMYAFSSAQAGLLKEADMFIVLQDSENGMGIVNKTSLKIYNDPFNYFNFLKACISGLIDAGKIPENERQNQPKKSKRGNENKDEITAYTQLQQLIVGWLQQGDHALVRAKISQIMDLWQQKQKSIRNRRFAMALMIVSNLNSSALSANRSLLINSAFSPTLYETSSADPADLASTAAVSEVYDPNSESSKLSQQRLAHDLTLNSVSSSAAAVVAANALLSSAGLDPSTIAKSSAPGTSTAVNLLTLESFPGSSLLSNPTLLAAAQIVQQQQQQQPQQSQHQQQQQQQQQLSQQPGTARLGVNVPTIVTQNISSATYGQPPAKYLRTAMTPSAGAAHSHHHFASSSALVQTPSAAETMFSGSVQSLQANGRSAAGSLSNTIHRHSASVLRFERVGGKEWEYKEIKVFNIDTLLQNYHGTVFLVDETKLSTEERQKRKFTTQSMGLISLSHELQQRNALVTSWPKNDHPHLRDFIEYWWNNSSASNSTSPNHVNGAASTSIAANVETMLQYWQRHSTSGGVLSEGEGGLSNSSAASMDVVQDEINAAASAACGGQGILAYEVVVQVGIVLRTNDALGIEEDCWRLVYPQEFLSYGSDESTATFAQFLIKMFPQVRSVLLKIDDLSTVIVKYFPHALESSVVSQPPKDDTVTAYQTIGTLSEQLEHVLSRFETSYLCFHDIVLHAT